MSKNVNQSKVGLILVAAGIFLLLGKLNLLPEMYFLYLLGGCFLVVYYLIGAAKNYGNIGFLIPGCVLIAINLFANLEESSFFNENGGGFFFILLGAAFVPVLLHTSRFKGLDWGSRFWPVFPAGGAMLFGAFILAVENMELYYSLKYLDYLTPFILVGLGIFFWVKGRKKQRSGNIDSNGQEGSQQDIK